MQNEWLQHRGRQPRRTACPAVLWTELLLDRGRRALRTVSWERLLQQKDPEKHIAEETQARHRQERKWIVVCLPDAATGANRRL